MWRVFQAVNFRRALNTRRNKQTTNPKRKITIILHHQKIIRSIAGLLKTLYSYYSQYLCDIWIYRINGGLKMRLNICRSCSPPAASSNQTTDNHSQGAGRVRQRRLDTSTAVRPRYCSVTRYIITHVYYREDDHQASSGSVMRRHRLRHRQHRH